MRIVQNITKLREKVDVLRTEKSRYAPMHNDGLPRYIYKARFNEHADGSYGEAGSKGPCGAVTIQG